MPDETTPATPAAAATTATSATLAAAPPKSAKEQAAALLGYDPDNPPWLKGRLDSAGQKVLEDLGVTDPAAAKAALAAANKAAEDAKSIEQKRVEAELRATQAEERIKALTGSVRTIVDTRLAGLTELQRKTITDLEDTDPEIQLELITKLEPTWAAIAAASSAPAATGAPPAATAAPRADVTPPANTAPAGGSPPPAVGSPPDHKAEYQRLKAKSPVAAAAYMNQHADKIYPRA